VRPIGRGGHRKRQSIATRPGGQITSPCDGWWFMPATFRQLCQLLILNAGGGYHVLLAGMERISVDLGQFRSGGRTRCGDGGGLAGVLTGGSTQPVLYVNSAKTDSRRSGPCGPQLKAKRFGG